jgi:membrane protease YdiL (CAAX protease family)
MNYRELIKSRTVNEVFTAYLLSLIILGIIGLSDQFIPASILPVLSAMTFIIVPIFVIIRKKLHFLNYGLKCTSLKRDFLILFFAAIFVFPVFSAGFHFYKELFFEKNFHFRSDICEDFSQTIKGRPDLEKIQERGKGIYAWIEGQSFFILNYSEDEKFRTAFSEKSEIVEIKKIFVKDNELFSVSLPKNLQTRSILFESDVRKFEGIKITFRNTEFIQLYCENSENLYAGQGMIRMNAKPFRADRNFMFLISFVLFQIFFVGIPEEFFYRGYVQTRLNEEISREFSFLGVNFGYSLFITSVLFAVGHYVTEPDILRLAVFFPSLLFGFMREASGKNSGVVITGIFHGLCNVLLYVLENSF